jgi:hypothetical protein
LGLILATSVWCQEHDLEKRVLSKEPEVAKAGIDDLLKTANRADPWLLMHAAHHLFQSGKKDEALFWFYAGQLRSRYWPKLAGENAQLITIAVMSHGPPINAHGMRDVPKMVGVIKKVLAWDEETFEAWSAANNIGPRRAEVDKKRAVAREGLVTMYKELAANRAKYEQQAREYKSPEQRQREMIEKAEAEVRKNFSTAFVTCTIAGKTLRVPANYIAPWHSTAEAMCKLEYTLEITLFLPELSGYTRDNWRVVMEKEQHKDEWRNVMYATINPNPDSRDKPEKMIADFIATRPPTVRAFGFDAYLYDYRETKARLPMNNTNTHYVLADKEIGTGPAYLVCGAPLPDVIGVNPNCELFLLDERTGLRIHARLAEKYAPQWQQIQLRLRRLLASWFDAGRMPQGGNDR